MVVSQRNTVYKLFTRRARKMNPIIMRLFYRPVKIILRLIRLVNHKLALLRRYNFAAGPYVAFSAYIIYEQIILAAKRS